MKYFYIIIGQGPKEQPENILITIKHLFICLGRQRPLWALIDGHQARRLPLL